MQYHPLFTGVRVVLVLLALGGLAVPGHAESKPDTATLQDAIKARTEVPVFPEEAIGRNDVLSEIQRNVVAKAKGKVEAGDLLLTKGHYGAAITAFQKAARLYQPFANSGNLLETLARAEHAVNVARLLAEAAAKPESLAAAEKFKINADGFLAADEFAAALAELEQARQAFEALSSATGPATAEDAVAARTAMLAPRDQINNLARYERDGAGDEMLSLKRRLARHLAGREAAPTVKGPQGNQAGSVPNLLDRACIAERAASDAMNEREYGPARKLYVAAEKYFREAVVLQGKWATAAALSKSVGDSLELANQACKGEARPASLERGRQLLHDAYQALDDYDFETAMALLAQAADQLAATRTTANAAKATPVIARLERSVADNNKFGAECILAVVESLIPSDGRLAGWRERVAAMPEPTKKLTVDLGDSVTMDFVLIRPGSFTMGLDAVVHQVTLTQPFYLGTCEVTQEQWEKVMGNNPSNFKGAKKPVERVSWTDCQSFVAKLTERLAGQTFRLPTEAEWEYACRAGTSGDYCYSDYCYGDGKDSLAQYAWYSGNAKINNGNAGITTSTQPVGGKKPNGWGLYDMHGNVWEWCADWHGDYPVTAVNDPQGAPAGSGRVTRGGGWSSSAISCRAGYRGVSYPSDTLNSIGLRLARSAVP